VGTLMSKDHIKPACRCGVPIKPNTTRYGVDDGRCHRHPERGTDAWKKRSQL